MELTLWEDRCGCFVDSNKLETVWVRVLGLPVFLWSEELFRALGDRCGGFVMMAEETMSREHVKWARICVRGTGISIPATLSIGMGSLVYMCAVWVESSARVVRRSELKRYCDGSRWREMMGKESAGQRVWYCLHPKWPGQRYAKYVEKDRINMKKERWPLSNMIQRRRVIGFKSGRGRLGISKVLRSDMIHGRRGRGWAFNSLRGGMGLGGFTLLIVLGEEILVVRWTFQARVDPISSSGPGVEMIGQEDGGDWLSVKGMEMVSSKWARRKLKGFRKFLGISYGGMEDEAARLFARIEELWSNRVSSREGRSRGVGRSKGKRELKNLEWSVSDGSKRGRGRSWSRGLNDPDKQSVIKGLLNQWKCSVICLQETKLKDVDTSIIRSLWGGRWVKWEGLRANGSAGGGMGDSLGLGGGDFNVVVRLAARVGYQMQSRAMRDFSAYIMEEDLIDLPLEGNGFTWSNGTTSSRLDRFLVCSGWEGEVFIEGLHRSDLRICGCKWKVSGSLLGSGGKGLEICIVRKMDLEICHRRRQAMEQSHKGQIWDSERAWRTKDINHPHGTSLWKGIMRGGLSSPCCDALVADCWSYSLAGGIWAPLFRRGAQDWEKEAFEDLFGMSQEEQPIIHDDDKWMWKRQAKGKFTVSTFYHSLTRLGDPTFPWKGVWVSRVPSKVCFFGWAAARGAILTMDNLRRRKIVVIEWCYMCKRNAESTDHLLIHCDVASELWRCVYAIFGVQWVMPATIKELFACWSQGRSRGGRRLAWRVVPLCLCWRIWRERNLRVFEDIENSLIFLNASFISLLFLWMRKDFPLSPASLVDFFGEFHSSVHT
ncbi:hypothetical protein Acr_00g0044890 [Actinidia rufa]|uniref:Reverse transcriptase zinc-binding domain-containing protein n=1 Tax=Actinidia rufa TaxID=165716 RepID=A0A7J0DJ12_9ERIC|nr:hypothetical protein Acr_00g0044890 [Actinidia rufa]